MSFGGDIIYTESELADVYLEGNKSLIAFRQLFLPDSDDESAPAWFHYEIDKVLRESREHFAIEAFRESAKALALDTEIPTPEGFKFMADLEVGDVVFDEKGNHCRITHVSEIFTNHDCYRLTFDDGTTIVADAGHLWQVLDKHRRKFRTIDTEEMFRRQKLGSPRQGYQEFAYRISVAGAIFMPEACLPIDPYLLGYWLGDGISDRPELSVGKDSFEEVKNLIQNRWQDITVKSDKNCNFKIRLTNGFMELLRSAGLLKNKHIPKQYLRASKNQRMELLRGLIDTDGTVSCAGTKSGTVTFTNTNRQLISDVAELVGSLGIKYTINEKAAKIYGKDCGLCWGISFKTTKRACSLKYKVDRLPKQQDNRSKMRTIVLIEKVDTVPTKCIRVDSPSHLFLVTRNCIITHNSTIVIRSHTLYRLMYPSKEYDFIVFVLANQRSASQKLKEIADEYVSNPVLSYNLVEVKEQSEKSFRVIVKTLDGEEIEVLIQAYGKGSSGLRGLISKDRRPKLVILDDPQDLADSESDTTQEADYRWFLSDVWFLGKHTRIFMIGNNLGEKCLIEQVMANKESLNFKTMVIPELNKQEESNWPSRFPTEKILEERDKWQELGQLEIWLQNKMCISMDPKTQTFKKEMFRYYSPFEQTKSGLSVYTTVDLAISEDARADYTAIVTVGVNTENHWFLLDIKYGRWGTDDVLDKLFETVIEFRPLLVGIEKVAFQKVMRWVVEKEMTRRNMYFFVKDLEPAGKAKEARIKMLQPRFNSGSIWFPMGAKWLNELETELTSFPKGIHDDVIDALAYQEQIAQPPIGGFGAVDDDSIPFAGSL